MPLAPGADAPAFSLPAGDGSEKSLADLTANGPALLAFFKTTCPTCKMAFPVYGELARRFGDALPVVAVSQDPVPDTVAWLDTQGFGGPFLDDNAGGYATSNAYDIQSVPTLVLVDGGKVVATSEGWDRERVNALAADLGGRTGRDTGPVSTKDDGRPPFRPG